MEKPEYHLRFQWLVQKGWTMQEAKDALEQTKQGDVYSSARADAHLRAVIDSERQQLMPSFIEQAQEKDSRVIAEDSATARILVCNPDAVDIVSTLKRIHANTKPRAAHTAKTAVAACSLVQLPSVQGDSSLARKGQPFLGQVALAVCEDCETCKEAREKAALEELQRAKAKAAKEEADAKRKKAQEEKAAEAKKRAANKPISLNFRSSDSKRDVTLPRLACANPTCGKGWEGGKWLYHCGACRRGYHETHTEFTLVRNRDGKEYFTCTPCTEQREQLARRQPESSPQVLGSDIANGKAPHHQEALDDRETPTSGAGQVPQTPTPGQTQPFAQSFHLQTPPRSGSAMTDDLRATAGGGDRGSEKISGGTAPSTVQKELNFSTGNFPGEKGLKSPTFTMKDYFIWECIPKEWKAPVKDGVPQDHPTHGWSKTAYQYWRKRNVNLRDSHVSGSAALGPLIRAISTELKPLIGAQLMLKPAQVKQFCPYWQEGSSEQENLIRWIEKDQFFGWFDKLTDKELLGLLDQHFGLGRADTFLSRRFIPEGPDCNAHGDINYHSVDFARWSTEWQSDMAELHRTGGSALQGIDLRQTLLNALSDCSLLHQHASMQQTPSALMLLAYMRDWTMRKDDETLARQNERASLLAQAKQNKTKISESKAAPAKALFSQAAEQVERVHEHPPSANLKTCGKFGESFRCEGCGNIWKNARTVPCSPTCRYVEHPDFNKEWKNKPFGRNQFLSWKGFRERFPNIQTLPRDLLEWEAKSAAYLAKKRARPDNAWSPAKKP